MTLTDSSIKVSWTSPLSGTVVLVGMDAPMWEEVSIDGGQDVEEQALYRAPGISAVPRGNERTTIRFVLGLETEGPAEAQAAAMAAAAGWPRDQGEVSIELKSGGSYVVRKAACRSWPAGAGEEHIARIGLEIIGGKLEQDD